MDCFQVLHREAIMHLEKSRVEAILRRVGVSGDLWLIAAETRRQKRTAD
jgi:hypothetical protein